MQGLAQKVQEGELGSLVFVVDDQEEGAVAFDSAARLKGNVAGYALLCIILFRFTHAGFIPRTYSFNT